MKQQKRSEIIVIPAAEVESGGCRESRETCIPLVIPAYEPDEQLIELCHALAEKVVFPVILVDDGSGSAYRDLFSRALDILGQERCLLLQHVVNQGKGRALKTAFDAILQEYPEAVGCITADSDGQHTPEDILKCKQALSQQPDSLVLGVRDFDREDVPGKSVFGNKLTRVVMQYMCGISVTDTQTGLRAIPASFMRDLLNVSGERFEFETNMLIATKQYKIPITEVPIRTIYDSKEAHKTHFHPLRDSLRIYSLFGEMFLRFIFSSLSSSVLDLVLFQVFCQMLKGMDQTPTVYVAIATVAARLISATYNYILNYKIVFRSNASKRKSALKYVTLAAVQMCMSAVLVMAGVAILSASMEVWVKVVVDTVLFFISYAIQREFVFGR